VLRSVKAQRRQDDRSSPIRILPVLMRMDLSEKSLHDRAMQMAKATFHPYLEDVFTAAEAEKYWSQNQIPYVPHYAYFQILPVFAAALGEASDAIRNRRDATLPLLRARRALHGPPEVSPALSPWSGGGGE